MRELYRKNWWDVWAVLFGNNSAVVDARIRKQEKREQKLSRKQPFIQRCIVDKMGRILKFFCAQPGSHYFYTTTEKGIYEMLETLLIRCKADMERENTETVVYCIAL